jgi:probable rRNA maturation factor
LVVIHKRVAGLTELALGRFVARAGLNVGLRGGVDVLLTSSAQMRRLNRRFRGKDKPTDVLSFPAPIEHKNEVAGDVAISAEIAARNARTLGHSAAEEVKILALHGILHLRGYDHERDHGQMAKREQELRREFGLPLGLIERARPAPTRRAVSGGARKATAPKSRPTSRLTPRPAPRSRRPS